MVVGDSLGRVFVWDFATGLERYLLKGHAGSISEVAFSPDGRFLASGSGDGTVRLWNMADGSLARVITGFMDDVSGVEFTQDGRQLRIKVSGQSSQVFDMNTALISESNEPVAIATPDPYAIELLKLGFMSGSPKLSPDGKTLVMVDDWVITRWDIASKKMIDYWLPPSGENVYRIKFSPDGRIWAIITDGDEMYNTKFKFAIWDTQDNRQIFPSTGTQSLSSGKYWEALAVSASGDLIAVGGENQIEIWDISANQRITEITLESPKDRVTDLAFSADESQLYAVLRFNEAFRIFDLQTGKQIDAIEFSPAHDFSDIALHWPWFARGNGDGDHRWVELWNLESKTIQMLDVLNYGIEVCISTDGHLLFASTNKLEYFWQIPNGKLLHTTSNSAFSCSGRNVNGKTVTVHKNLDKVEFWDISALIQLAQQPAITPAILPTPVYAYSEEITSTPQPTLEITPQPLPTLPAGAIAPENAAQVREVARFGQGSIEEILWSPDKQSVMAVGSQGIRRYTANTLTHSDTYQPAAWLTSAAYTADGRLLAAGKDGATIQVWDTTNNTRLVETIGRGQPVISPNGTLLVFADSGDDLQVWDIESNQPIARLNCSLDYCDKPVFSPDSQFVAAVQFFIYDRESNSGYQEIVRVWEARTGKIVNAFGGPNWQITDLSFSADGKFVVAASGGTAWIWDMDPRAAPYTLTLDAGRRDYNFLLFDNRVNSAALSPDNRILAIGTSQRTIWLYDRRSRGVLRQLEGHSNAVHRLHFSPDGQYLFSADLDGRLMMWEVASGKLLASQHEHLGPLVGMLFGDDGNLHAWEGNTAWVIRPEDGAVVRATSIYTGTIFAASPDGRHLAVYSRYRASLWDAQTGQMERLLEGEPSGVGDWRHLDTRKDFTVAAFSPDSQRLVVGGSSGIWVYDASGNLLASPDTTGVYSFPGQVAFHPNNEHIATLRYQNYYGGPTIQRLGTSTDFYIQSDDVVQHVAFTPAGDLLGGISTRWEMPDAFNLWQMADGTLRQSLPFPGIHLTSLAFSPDGRVVAIGQEDGKIILLDFTTFETLTTLSGHNGSVQNIAFAPNGEFLASASTDGTIRIWSIP